jgi:V-type H+-transporting ATPase subunit H
VELFIKLLFNIHQTDKLRYVLWLIDVVFENSPRFQHEFLGASKININPYTPFLRLLIKNEAPILEKSVKALTTLFALDPELHQQELESFLDALTTQLTQAEKDESKARMCVQSLMILLKKDECRPLFYKARGVPPLIQLLKIYSRDEQMLYEAVLCLWLLSFNKVRLSVNLC